MPPYQDWLRSVFFVGAMSVELILFANGWEGRVRRLITSIGEELIQLGIEKYAALCDSGKFQARGKFRYCNAVWSAAAGRHFSEECVQNYMLARC